MTISCVYCGRPATDKDHIPPRCLFPPQRRNGIISVPSCKECNVGAAEDDEYFRLFIAGHSAEHSQAAKEIFEGPIARGAGKRPKMAKNFITRMEVIETHSPSGLFTGRATATRFTSRDWERYFNVVNRTVKGLLYHRYKEVVPEDYELRTIFCDDEQLKLLLPILSSDPLHTTSDIFHYAHGKAVDSPSSLWVMSFYEKITFATWVTPKGFLAPRPKNKERVVDLR